jgi:hypothetical protein
MGTSGKRPRKPRTKLPPVPHYVRPPRYGRYWKLGGPLTSDHEAEALAAERSKRPGRLGRLVLRLLGGSASRR